MSVGSLLNTGIEMEDMRKKFLQKCRISLRPWFDLSYSTVRTKFKEQSKQVIGLLYGKALVLCSIVEIQGSWRTWNTWKMSYF